LPSTGLDDWFRNKCDRLWGLASGRGVYENISQAYLFLMKNYLPGDHIYFFGFWQGTCLSIAGEAMGAAISFLLYRYWFRTGMQSSLQRFPKAGSLVQSTGNKAAVLVIGMRLLPMVPSGIVTFAAAIGQMGFYMFIVASTLGKIPALLMEASLVQGFLVSGWPFQLGASVLAIIFLVLLYKRFRKKQS